jgi:hypothetical protein
MPKSSHPKKGDLYTPVNQAIWDLFDLMRARHGSWREVAYLSNTRLKVLRRWRRGEVKAISMTKLDELITTTEVGSLRDYVWFTADDLVAMGIWEKPAEPLNASPRRERE